MSGTDIQQYLNDHCSPEAPLLRKLTRDTYLKTLYPRMLSGHYQGRLLSIISSFIKPQRILEIGTFTGYSALCLAEGLASNGTLITIEVNEEILQVARGFFEQSPYNAQIISVLGDAAEIVKSLEGPFDLVFIDADKKSNERYVHQALNVMNQGGVILIDNVLWSGKVLSGATDTDTSTIRKMNDRLANLPGTECIILPVRDGLMILRKS